jgi:hypothetical protein
MRWFVAQAPQVDEMNGTRTEMADANGHATDPAIRGQSGSRHAPVYTVPRRSFSAVEHPMLVRDIDKGIATFGRKFNFQEARGIKITSLASINADLVDRYCSWRIPVRPSRCTCARTTLR